jgi:hypothetical protein
MIMLTRRDVMRLAVLGGAAVTLTGCGGSSPGVSWQAIPS